MQYSPTYRICRSEPCRQVHSPASSSLADQGRLYVVEIDPAGIAGQNRSLTGIVPSTRQRLPYEIIADLRNPALILRHPQRPPPMPQQEFTDHPPRGRLRQTRQHQHPPQPRHPQVDEFDHLTHASTKRQPFHLEYACPPKSLRRRGPPSYPSPPAAGPLPPPLPQTPRPTQRAATNRKRTSSVPLPPSPPIAIAPSPSRPDSPAKHCSRDSLQLYLPLRPPAL